MPTPQPCQSPHCNLPAVIIYEHGPVLPGTPRAVRLELCTGCYRRVAGINPQAVQAS